MDTERLAQLIEALAIELPSELRIATDILMEIAEEVHPLAQRSEHASVADTIRSLRE